VPAVDIELDFEFGKLDLELIEFQLLVLSDYKLVLQHLISILKCTSSTPFTYKKLEQKQLSKSLARFDI